MGQKLKFIKAFFRNPLSVGAIMPSSAYLAKAMTHDLEIDENESVLELGVGTGAFTDSLSKLIPSTECYIGIERNEKFIPVLHQRFPELHFVHGSAEHAFAIHRALEANPVRYIISGLPFASLPKTISQNILNDVDKFMAQGCVFRTFQYIHAYRLPPAIAFRQFLNERYGKCERSKIIMNNVPPAYTLTWRT